MYKRIYDSEEIVVDYYNDGKPMIRVSQFKDYHWQDEHFVELPEEVEPVVHARWIVPDDNYPDTCSNCLFEFVWDGDDEYHPKRCPNCGAHMDEEVSHEG